MEGVERAQEMLTCMTVTVVSNSASSATAASSESPSNTGTLSLISSRFTVTMVTLLSGATLHRSVSGNAQHTYIGIANVTISLHGQYTVPIGGEL